MKRLLTAALLALTSAAFGATTTPVQLLNPTGSTAGQAIVSTGPTTAPAWGAAALSPIGANTVLGNATGSTAAPAAVSVPNCLGTSSALTYTAGSGFNCNSTINALTLGGATFAAPGPIGSTSTSSGAFSSISTPSATIGGGTIDNTAIGATSASTGKFTTLQATAAITPSQASGIVGTTTNNNANAGSVGEYVTASTSGTSMTNGVSFNCASASLTAGDWDVSGAVQFIAAAGTTVSGIVAGSSATSATLGAVGSAQSIQATLTTGSPQTLAVPTFRYSLASTTTVFIVGNANFATSTMTCTGFIRARRVR
jgi:hypothetical protein